MIAHYKTLSLINDNIGAKTFGSSVRAAVPQRVPHLITALTA